MAAALTITSSPDGAQATAQDQTAIAGTLTVEVDDQREPVPGVEVEVTSGEGTDVGSDESDEDGEVFIELPGPGDYVVTLDTETLPDGIDLRDPERSFFEVDVDPGQVQQVLFALTTEDASATTTTSVADTDDAETTDDEDSSTGLLVIVAVVLVVGGVVLLLLVRRSAARPKHF